MALQHPFCFYPSDVMFKISYFHLHSSESLGVRWVELSLKEIRSCYGAVRMPGSYCQKKCIVAGTNLWDWHLTSVWGQAEGCERGQHYVTTRLNSCQSEALANDVEVNSSVPGSMFSDKSAFTTSEKAYNESCKSVPTNTRTVVHLTGMS
jgi:hypothetical protein